MAYQNKVQKILLKNAASFSFLANCGQSCVIFMIKNIMTKKHKVNKFKNKSKKQLGNLFSELLYSFYNTGSQKLNEIKSSEVIFTGSLDLYVLHEKYANTAGFFLRRLRYFFVRVLVYKTKPI